jgi:thioredoxin 1
MNKIWKIVIVLLLASAVVAVIAVKRAENKETQKPVIAPAAKKTYEINEVNLPAAKSAEPNNAPLVMTVKVVEPVPAASLVEPKKLPRMIELGSDQCIPCKMMAPIIEELTSEYKGRLQVEFYDVWKNPGEGKKFGIRVIPTQIFIDPNDKEIFRHEGFFAKADILARWTSLGYDFSKAK